MRKLTEDALHIEQELVAEVTGQIAPGGLALLCHGLAFEGRRAAAGQGELAERDSACASRSRASRPGVVPWMCEQVGLRLTALKRIRLGRLPMARLAQGQWRYLRPGERF